MIDIIALIFITREIGILAIQKGVKPLRWKIYVVATWLIFEIIGFIFGFMFFDMDNLFSVIIMGLLFAFSGYLFVKNRLNSLPDKTEDDNYKL
ncbi:hypothetical protein [Paracoccus sp. (in: a-proteobacteria)]|uniref:hypothetical protein n=1 Tax=Paracoccus sp. TaxID=267 RepID=UPI002AFE73FB|nr:hypothetical protein [Paracoccus sp. (in: a-proteobacteria)]